MTYSYATWLEKALRSDPVVESRLLTVGGWGQRGRAGDGVGFAPSGVVNYQCECSVFAGHDPQACLNGILGGDEDAPVCSVLGTWTPPGVKYDVSNVDPRVILVAAGRTDRADAGIWPWGAPSGDGSVVGVMWCGPPSLPDSGRDSWPAVITELYARVDACILRHSGWGVDRLTTGFEYSRPMGRATDPSGSWVGEPDLKTSTTPWNPRRWREYVESFIIQPDATLDRDGAYTVASVPTDIVDDADFERLKTFFIEHGWWPAAESSADRDQFRRIIPVAQRAFESYACAGYDRQLAVTGEWDRQTAIKIDAWARSRPEHRVS